MRLVSVVCAASAALLFQSLASPAQDHSAPQIRRAPSYLSGREARAAELYERVLPAVVTVFTREERLTDDGREEQLGVGSGVLVSPECHILTAAHVVDGADAIVVKTQDGELRPASLLFSDGSADVALLQLDSPELDLPHARLGDSDQLAVGQDVYVVGTPYGLENSFTIGHVSAFREFNRLYDGTILAEFIQTDAAINSGNSGGPVFNSQGEVIGISSRILTVSGGFQGLGFVVTINTAKALLALEERPWMGFEAIYLTRDELAELLNIDQDGGLLVQRVIKGSPADRAGLRGGTLPARIGRQELMLGGDLLLVLGDQEACHSECLVRSGPHIRGRDDVHVKFLRGGKFLEADIDVSKTRRSFFTP